MSETELNYGYSRPLEDIINESNWQQVRQIRDVKLASTDWVVVKAQEHGLDVELEWQNYRQQLRDITETFAETGPESVVWPEKPA